MWWKEENPTIKSAMVDASSYLPYRLRDELYTSLFSPVLRHLQEKFAYQGPARWYIERSVKTNWLVTDRLYRENIALLLQHIEKNEMPK